MGQVGQERAYRCATGVAVAPQAIISHSKSHCRLGNPSESQRRAMAALRGAAMRRGQQATAATTQAGNSCCLLAAGSDLRLRLAGFLRITNSVSFKCAAA